MEIPGGTLIHDCTTNLFQNLTQKSYKPRYDCSAENSGHNEYLLPKGVSE